MHSIYRPYLCVLFAVYWLSVGFAEDKPSVSRADYDKFLQEYTGKPRRWQAKGQQPLKLIVTALVGDEPTANGEPDFDQLGRAGIEVSADWQVYWFDIDSHAAKGGTSSSSKISGADRKRLEMLLSKLPDDGGRLPPFDRRLVLQVPEGDHCRAKVYDRGNAPDVVCEILRLSQSRIRSWVLEFKSKRDINPGADGKGDIPALTSKGQLVTTAAKDLPDDALAHIKTPDGKRAVVLLKGNIMALWDVEGHRQYATLDENVKVQEVAISPDQSMVAISTGNNCIRIWKLANGELVHLLRPYEADCCRSVVGLQWTADGQYVLAATNPQPMFDDSTLDIWSVKSGRHRATLIDGIFRPTGVASLPDGRHIAAGTGAGVRIWDLAEALKQVRTLEDSLGNAKAGK